MYMGAAATSPGRAPGTETLGLDGTRTRGLVRVGALASCRQAQGGRQWAGPQMLPRGILGLQPDAPYTPHPARQGWGERHFPGGAVVGPCCQPGGFSPAGERQTAEGTCGKKSCPETPWSRMLGLARMSLNLGVQISFQNRPLRHTEPGQLSQGSAAPSMASAKAHLAALPAPQASTRGCSVMCPGD